MTVTQIVNRLSRNSVEFLLAGEKEKSNACMDLLSVIKEKNLVSVKGKLAVDIL